MVADVKDNDLKQLTVRWIGRRGSASITHRQLTKELNAQRVNIDDDQIHLTLKLINQNLNGTQYRYLVYNNMGQNYTSAWARLIVGNKPDIRLASHLSKTKLNATEGDLLPPICITMSGLPYPNISVYQFTSEIQETKHIERENYSFVKGCLHMGRVESADNGKLAVVASNCFGSSSLVLDLTVLQSYPCDEITDAPTNRELPSGSTQEQINNGDRLAGTPTNVWKIPSGNNNLITINLADVTATPDSSHNKNNQVTKSVAPPTLPTGGSLSNKNSHPSSPSDLATRKVINGNPDDANNAAGLTPSQKHVVPTDVLPSQGLVGQSVTPSHESTMGPVVDQNVRPAAPGKPEIFAYTETTVHLKWSEGDNGQPAITGYKIEFKMIPGVWQHLTGVKISSTEFVIENLRPNTTYRFRLRAVNSAGQSPWSKPSTIVTTRDSDDNVNSLTTSGADIVQQGSRGTSSARPLTPTAKSKIQGTNRDPTDTGVQTYVSVSDKVSVTESVMTTPTRSTSQGNMVSDDVSQMTPKPSQLVTHATNGMENFWSVRDDIPIFSLADLATIQQTTERPQKGSLRVIAAMQSELRPGPPTELKIVSFTAMTAHLKWEKGFDGHSQISRYKLEYKIGTGVWQRFPGLKIPSSTEFVIENLVPNTSYKFRIKSFNDVGSSVWSKPSLVITTKIQESYSKYS
ncbi:protein sidekick-1-like [Corticium candelabrum]|uniref:protein sidekick-1-like n=1 Tax=Corticium candelabrum TaxID=121492 RepID=UPI002E262EFB|nr:protein sidekick-1-like [Corticium candelabrum]